MADALTQVLGAHQGIMSGAQSQQAGALEAYDAELAKTEQSKLEQQKIMEEAQAKKAEVMALPETPKPDVPTMAPVPTKPVEPEENPLKTFGQMIPLIAALAASKTSQSAVFALNASTAALNAMEANDQKALAKAHQDWMDNVKSTLENNRILGDQYKMIMEDRQASWNEKLSKLQVIAAESKDNLAMAALKAGNPEAILKRQEMLDKAAEPIQQMYTEAQRQQIQREEMQMRRDLASAQLAMDAQKMDDVSLTDVIGRLALKMSKGEALNPGEQKVWDQYDEWRQKSGTMLPGMGGGMYGQPAADPDAMPPPGGPAPAQPAPAAKPAASATPPVSKLKEGEKTTFANGQVWTLRNGKPVRVG